MSSSEPSNIKGSTPGVQYVPPAKLKIYQIYEHDLDCLASGSISGLYLNFALTLLSIAVTLAVTLMSTRIASNYVYQGFVSACFASTISGLVLLALWWRARQHSRSIVAKLKRSKCPSNRRSK